MPHADDSTFPDMSLNYQRGLGLLHLAAEQMRIFDPRTAETIHTQHLGPLRRCFDSATRNRDVKSLNEEHTIDQTKQMRQLASNAWSRDIRPGMPPTPPGLGFDALGFDEASAPASPLAMRNKGLPLDVDITPKAPNYDTRLLSSPWTPEWHSASEQRSHSLHDSPLKQYSPLCVGSNIRKDFGAIGSKPELQASQSHPMPVMGPLGQQSRSTQPEQLGLRAHPRDDRNGTQKRNDTPSTPQDPEGFAAAVMAFVHSHKEELLSSLQPPKARDTSFYDSSSSIQSPDVGAVSPGTPWSVISEKPRRPGALQNVFDPSAAASTPVAKKEETGVPRAPEPASGPSTWAKIAAIPAGATNGPIAIAVSSKTNFNHAPNISRPKEPAANEMRVAWVANLPASFTLRDVSMQITCGPVYSILIQNESHRSIPGRNACIIFQQAEHASMFLQENGWDFDKERFRGPTTYATRPITPDNPRKVGVASITILPGPPYPMDAHLLSMGLPSGHGRRRIKWSLKGLFYDVSQRQFKKDVLSIVGGYENIELFHFYNPGEGTVVFASVGVAAACLAKFEVWRAEKLEGYARWTKEEYGTPKKMTIGRLDKVKGKYEGVDVGFVKDFNEAPGKLYSHYAKDGRLSDRTEGLFEGPKVPWP